MFLMLLSKDRLPETRGEVDMLAYIDTHSFSAAGRYPLQGDIHLPKMILVTMYILNTHRHTPHSKEYRMP